MPTEEKTRNVLTRRVSNRRLFRVMELTVANDGANREQTLVAGPSFAASVSLAVSPVLGSLELVGLIIGLLLIGSTGYGDLLG